MSQFLVDCFSPPKLCLSDANRALLRFCFEVLMSSSDRHRPLRYGRQLSAIDIARTHTPLIKSDSQSASALSECQIWYGLSYCLPRLIKIAIDFSHSMMRPQLVDEL